MDEDHPHIFSIKDALEEQMYGKEGVAKRRRAAELEHERELAQVAPRHGRNFPTHYGWLARLSRCGRARVWQ